MPTAISEPGVFAGQHGHGAPEHVRGDHARGDGFQAADVGPPVDVVDEVDDGGDAGETFPASSGVDGGEREGVVL
ncbi:hypothetical protein ACFP2T_05535 [Plantactinospora solaniradicis]|uniref:Uncharacterized protein n=1 Tax=Plantactinospora solaniradicis TaxID=1723736 RepID=A0ABW1K2G1_9ACTN